jgi:hypothetical protein
MELQEKKVYTITNLEMILLITFFQLPAVRVKSNNGLHPCSCYILLLS